MLGRENGTNASREDGPNTPRAPLALVVDRTEKVDVEALVEGARDGEPWAWNALVRRFLPLVRGVARGYRLNDRDAEDIAQIVWLRLVEHLERLREPRALPKWIITTARHESGRLARSHARTLSIDSLADPAGDLPAEHPDVDSDLLRAEEAQALRDGLAELPAAQRDLLLLLAAEPPPSYREVSRLLDMPLGSIGPTRARSLARLGATSAVSALGSGHRHPGRACSA